MFRFLPVLASGLLVLSALLLPGPSHAGPLPKFTGLVVFGDSLSDTGNSHAAVQAKYSIGFPGVRFDYAPRRFTDGAATTPAATAFHGVWHEQLARLFLQLKPAQASARGGTDYAFGDAKTIAENSTVNQDGLSLQITNLGPQLDEYLGDHIPDPLALHIVWCGSNDLFDDTSDANISTAAQNVANAIKRLETAGARQFMVVNLPPLGSTPSYRKSAAHAQTLNAAATSFNLQLAADLDSAKASFPPENAVKIYRVDASALFEKLAAHPAAYGLQNIHGSAQGKAVNPDRWLFWDEVHPTVAGHHLLAVAAKKILREP